MNIFFHKSYLRPIFQAKRIDAIRPVYFYPLHFAQLFLVTSGHYLRFTCADYSRIEHPIFIAISHNCHSFSITDYCTASQTGFRWKMEHCIMELRPYIHLYFFFSRYFRIGQHSGYFWHFGIVPYFC